MQKNMTDRTPGSYDDFVAYLGTVRTEEELFSRLTYWFAGQDRPEDVLSRSELVEARAKELGFWKGLTFRMERWLADGKSELEAVGREEFQSRIAEDYAAYREKADAARARFRDRRRAAPFNFTPDCLENVPIQNVSWLVDGLLPMGEVSLLGADGGTGKGIWQAQLIAYVTAGRTSGFFPQPPEKTGSVLLFSGEDDPGKVLKARLTAAGADMSRVMVVTSDAYFARTGSPLCIPDTSFAKYVGKAAPALVIIDPLQSFLPAGVEMASRNQMRSALLPLKALCAKHGCAALISMHTNKRANVSGRARLADSSDIWDIARSVLMMGRDKNSEKLSALGLGLEDRMKQPVGLLSGGQRQALTLLMATLVTPKLLLLDEHTAALDPGTADKVLELTKKIVAENHLTCLMITHNMHDALTLGNRTLMMDHGHIVLDISGEERAHTTVDGLLDRFAENVGHALDNDRILLSKEK